ncbi:sorting nexin-11 [Taeniopygia guttata]|uniref:sorting nexin-11 n=1 Tax=Taeniopygia guttata TaxID=59729 RepID=UPI003BB8AEB9
MSPPHPRAGWGWHLGQHRRSNYNSQHAQHRNFRHFRAIKGAPPPLPLKWSAGCVRCFPLGSGSRMLENREEELTTVRVQDPRVQNEGSWNSYVDYKIFLHTNSKAFTAKTSCVRRRYREFVWLRRQLQRNAGSVPVPELPGKSAFFVGSTDEFIERRRQGLQHFLERVVQSAVLLSDSRLHLFLQSQLPVPAIEACVQGRGPRSVTDAILHYAMAGPAWGQRGDGAGMGAASCASARGCLESFPCWSDFGMDEARPDSPAGQRVTPPDSPECPAGH